MQQRSIIAPVIPALLTRHAYQNQNNASERLALNTDATHRLLASVIHLAPPTKLVFMRQNNALRHLAHNTIAWLLLLQLDLLNKKKEEIMISNFFHFQFLRFIAFLPFIALCLQSS